MLSGESTDELKEEIEGSLKYVAFACESSTAKYIGGEKLRWAQEHPVQAILSLKLKTPEGMTCSSTPRSIDVAAVMPYGYALLDTKNGEYNWAEMDTSSSEEDGAAQQPKFHESLHSLLLKIDPNVKTLFDQSLLQRLSALAAEPSDCGSDLASSDGFEYGTEY